MTAAELEAINAGIAFQQATQRLEALLADKVVKQAQLDELGVQIQSARDTLRDAKVRFKTAAGAL